MEITEQGMCQAEKIRKSTNDKLIKKIKTELIKQSKQREVFNLCPNATIILKKTGKHKSSITCYCPYSSCAKFQS